MAQTIQLKRGTELARTSLAAPAPGELLTTTDNYDELFIGDGVTLGGNALGYLSTRLGGTVGGSVIITGDLTVNGTVTSINSNEVNIGDAVILLNADETASPSQNAGFEVERGLASNVSILWDETSNAWTLLDSDDTEPGSTNAARRILDTADILVAGTGINITTGTVSNTDLGSSQNIFKTLTGDSGLITAASNTDTFKIAGAGSVVTSVTGNSLIVTGTDTTYTAGTGLALAGIDFSLDFSELTDKTLAIAGTDELILQSAGVESRKAVSEIDLSAFNNDLVLTTTFAELTDTPNTLGTVVANDPAITKLVAVNAAGSALVFIDVIDGGTF